jgi:hypothetical protein
MWFCGTAPISFINLSIKKNNACEEISKEMGISVAEVKKKMNNGRNLLFRHSK